MNKRLLILVFMIFNLLIYGQKTTFEKNVNYKARALNQTFNESTDSLFLKSKKTISQVDIFNKDYMKSIAVNGNETKIHLGELPLGRFIVQARLDRKRIIMYVTRTEALEEKPKIVLSQPKKPTKTSKKRPTAYWVVYETKSGSGSSKSMSLENEEAVSKMISKNKLELSTEIGKNNTLVVYEVYNTSKFMRKQLRNRNYFKSPNSKIFNAEPYYSSTNLDESI